MSLMNIGRDRCLELIQKFHKASVLVFGDIILDVYLDCEALGVANEAPVPLLEVSQQKEALGGAANVANNLARLGVQTQLIGMVGKDPEAEMVTALLRNAGIGFCPLLSDRPTIRKTRIQSGNQYYLRIDEEETSPLTSQEISSVLELVQKGLNSSSLVVVSDYDKGLVTAASATLLESLAYERRLRILADLKPRNATYWHHLDLITPNLVEARSLHALVCPGDSENLSEPGLAINLSQALGCDVVLKLAGRGMLVASRSGYRVANFPAHCKSPQNVTGAGDTVLSTLAAAMANGATVEEATYLANVAASLAVSREATCTVSSDELISQLGLASPA